MKNITKKIFLSILSVLLAFSVGATLYVNVSYADDGYLFNGNTSMIASTYQGTGKATSATKDVAPEGLSGKSYVYTNDNASVTFSYVSTVKKNTIGGYDAVRIIAKFANDMAPETLQFGVFNLAGALGEGESLKNSCIMDAAGIRWEKGSGVSSITAGWNVITLPLDKTDAFDGFARNSYIISNDERQEIDSFAIRAFGGGTVFEVDIYSVELVTISDTVKPGVKVYGQEEVEEPDTSDVMVSFSSWDDFTEGTESIGGKEYKTYGCTGWGGFLKYFVTDKAYNIKDIADTGKGALSFRLYITDETVLNAYKNASTLNIDICSAETYNDTNKYTVVPNNIFENLKIGWNKIVLPLAKANEKNAIDFTTIRHFRLNGGGFAAGTNTVKFADFRFVVTDYTENTVVDESTVVPAVKSWEDLTKGTAEINGTNYDTYGCTGWGGFAKKLIFDKPYDASFVNSTGKGALVMYFYIENENLLAQYISLGNDNNSWNIDVYGSDAYSDSLKLSYNIGGMFKDFVCGWNKIILPFDKADEKNNMNFETICAIRLNCTAFGIGRDNNIAVAGLTFTTTDYTEKTVEGKITDVTFGLTDAGEGLNVSEITVGDNTFDGVYVNGWGGYVRVLTLDETYDVLALKNSGRGALAFRFYFKDEADLNYYKSVTTWNFDVCSADSYEDAHKASFNIAGAFSMCEVGWNRVIVPLSAGIIDANGSVDWSSIKNIRVNASQVGGTPTYTGFGDISVILSDVTELTVEGYVPPEPEPGNYREPCDVDSGLHIESFDEAFGDGVKETGTGFVKEGSASMRLTGQGTAGTGKVLAHTFNLSGYDALSFNLYVDDAATFLAMADGQLELTSSGRFDDNNEYHWELKNLKLKDGWNYVVLYFKDAVKSGDVDITKIDYLRFYFVGLSSTVTTIFDDMHVHKTEGALIEGFDGSFRNYVENTVGKVGNCLNMSGDGWQDRVKYSEPVDISDADKIAMWVNCLDESTCKQIAGTEMEISSSGTCDVNELTFHFPNDLKVGWNYLLFDIKTATRTGGECDLTAVNFVGFIKTGLSGIRVYFDDLRAIESRFALAETTEKIDKKIILDCDKVVDGVFAGLTVDDENAKEGVASLTTNGQNKDEILTATFAPVKTGLSLKGDNELGYTFWFYVEKLENLSSLSVELSSSADCDSFELEWSIDLANLESGWNWITLKAFDAQRVGGVIDVDSIVRTRIIAFGKDGTTNTIKLDCFQIVDSTIEGAFDKVETKKVLNPVTSVDANDCEQAWENGTVDETNKKAGFASILVKGNGNATVSASGTVNTGKTDLLVTNYKQNNKLGVSFWLFVEDTTKVSSVTFTLTAGTGSITWTLAGLENGWNWVVLSVADNTVSVTGNADADNITLATLTVNAAVTEEATADFTVRIDRVKVINAGVEANYAEPADESQNRNYVKELVIIDCNTAGGTIFTGNKVDKEDYRYGNGSVYTSGAGYALNATDLDVGKTDLTKDTIVLAFWVWIENPALYNKEGIDGQVELSSNNAYDKAEINWNFIPVAKTLSQGWNWVVFRGSEAEVSDGMPDFDNLRRFRIYVNNIDSSMLKVDRITIGYVGNESLFTAPDWEKEIDKNGTFKGPNGKLPENNTYIEVDFEEAEAFTAIEEAGCESNAGAECGIIAVVAIALSVVLKRKQKSEVR